MDFLNFSKEIRSKAAKVNKLIEDGKVSINTKTEILDVLLNKMNFDKIKKQKNQLQQLSFADIVATNLFNEWYPNKDYGKEYETIKSAVEDALAK